MNVELVLMHHDERPHPCHGGQITLEWTTGLDENRLYIDYDEP